MLWWIALGILILLAVIPLRVCVKYDEDGPLVKVLVGWIPVVSIPSKRQKKRPVTQRKPEEKNADTADPPSAEQAAPASKPKKPAKKKEPSQKKGGSLTDFLPLVQVALNFLGDFLGKTLHVELLECNLILAGDDPCDLATNYGRAWAAVGNLWPRLEQWLTIQKRDVQIQCDFTASETVIFARLHLNLTLGRLVSLLVRYGVRALKEYLKIRKKRKGGAVK